jgi:hypothetical protein
VFLLRRHKPFVPLELGAVILVALLAGPVTWDHYPTWAILSIILMVDLRLWEHRRVTELWILAVLFVGATGLMWKRTQYPTPEIVASDWTRRLESGSKTVAMLVYLAIALWLLARPPGESETSARRLGSEHAETDADTDEASSGEKGVHARR